MPQHQQQHHQQQPPVAVEPPEPRATDEGWSLAAVLREDYRRHGASLASAGFRALAVHRLLRRRRRIASPLLRRAVGIPLVLAWRYMRSRHRIELPVSTVIGRRVRLSDLGDICLGAATVGDACDLGPGVTVALVGIGARGVPR